MEAARQRDILREIPGDTVKGFVGYMVLDVTTSPAHVEVDAQLVGEHLFVTFLTKTAPPADGRVDACWKRFVVWHLVTSMR